MYFDAVILLLAKDNDNIVEYARHVKSVANESSLKCIVKICYSESKDRKHSFKDPIESGILTYRFLDKSFEYIINLMLPSIKTNQKIIIMTDDLMNITSSEFDMFNNELAWNPKSIAGVDMKITDSISIKAYPSILMYNVEQSPMISGRLMCAEKRYFPSSVEYDYEFYINMYYHKMKYKIIQLDGCITISNKSIIKEMETNKERLNNFEKVSRIFYDDVPQRFNKSIFNKHKTLNINQRIIRFFLFK